MREVIARKIIENGEEIIELDLNKPWPKRKEKYSNYMDEVENLSLKERKPRKTNREFIKVLN